MGVGTGPGGNNYFLKSKTVLHQVDTPTNKNINTNQGYINLGVWVGTIIAAPFFLVGEGFDESKQLVTNLSSHSKSSTRDR